MRNVSPSGHYSSVGFNKFGGLCSNSKFFQYGGCISTLLGRTAHGACGSGKDPTGLGRFVWTRIKGKATGASDEGYEEGEINPSRSKDLILVSAYRPNPSTKGDNTVWIQHKQFFASQGIEKDPREAFTDDLLHEIIKWRSQGFEVIVGVDVNEELQFNGPNSFRHRMRAAGMEEAVMRKHGEAAPATYQHRTIQIPIDGLFVSPGVVVEQSGYLGFADNINSDHRCLWMDINLKETLGGFTPSKSKGQTRKLNMTDGRAVQRYIAIAESEYLRLNIPNRLSKLAHIFWNQNGVLRPSQIRRFNFLHQQMYNARRTAERQCRKLHTGGVPWSPALQEIRDRIHLWKMLRSAAKGRPVSSRKLRRLMNKTRLLDAWRMSLDELEDKLAEDTRLYSSIKKTPLARQWRSQFVLKRRDWARRRRHKSLHGLSRFERLQRMRQREEARRRKKAQGKGATGGLRAIQIEQQQENGSTRLVTLTDPNLVAEGCMRENQSRYDQTRAPYATPPMQEPLYSMFTGPDACANVQNLVHGSLPDQPVDQYTNEFLKHCRIPSSLPRQDMSVSVEDHIDFWAKTKEEKGSEPHGLHNGHYKAGAKSDLLAQCDTIMRDIPMRSGISPELWRHLMNFSIEKQPGEFRLSKMRTIQMMNSELQANNKKVGKAAMKYAEEHKLIPPGQCGSRKSHESIALVISKRLNWDLLRQQRRAAGWISNDAKSCFDRIVHWVGMVALYRFGIPWSTLLMMFGTLQLAQHRVRTGFGDSDQVFSPPSEIPFQGCGQGNGAGPTIWVAVSAILIGAMQAAGFGFSFFSAISGVLILADCFCFVDDSDVVEAAKSVESSGEDILDAVQKAMYLWAGLVRATGGALNPPKCFWWLIDFKWDAVKGVWHFRKPNDFDWNSPANQWQHSRPSEWIGALLTWNLDGSLVPIRQLQPSESEKTLGVMMSPDDDGSAEFKYLQEKAAKWAETVRSGYLKKYDVLPLIRTTIMKTLEYPMALTTFSFDQWLEIMKPVLLTCLPKAGVCRNFKRLAVFAPVRYQGLGLPNPVVTQLLTHLQFLQKHLSRVTQTTPYLKAVLEGHRLETGTSYGLFQQVFQNTGILTSESWVKRIWEEMDRYDIHVETDSPDFQLLRVGDGLIMEEFMNQRVPQEELKWLNWCRLFLHAVTISDIVTADGKFIDPDSWNGRRSCSRKDRFEWPRTKRPSETHWNTWRRWIQKTFVKSGSSSRALRNPLGGWLDTLDDWRWVFSPSENILLHRQGHVWRECVEVSSSSRLLTKKFILPTVEPEVDEILQQEVYPTSRFYPYLPQDAVRTSVSVIPASTGASCSIISVTGTGEPAVIEPEPIYSSVKDAWKEASRQIAGAYGWVPDRIQIEGDEEFLFQCLMSGKLRMVTDGSFKHQMGTAVVQLRPKQKGHVIWIYCQTPGLQTVQSAYRSELIGILAGIMVASWLLEVWQKKSGSTHPVSQTSSPTVHVACDGLSALRNSFVYEEASPSQPQFDLVSSIRQAIRESHIEWLPRHVKGHADDHKAWKKLDWWEKRNVEVDKKATRYRDQLERKGRQRARNPRFFTEPCAIFIRGEKVSTLLRSQLDDVVLLPQLQEWWEERERLTKEGFSHVDWDVTERAMKALPAGIQRWCTKHISGMCAVGKMRVRRKLVKQNRCPSCGKPEDHHHVPRCTNPGACLHWDKCAGEFTEWMHSFGTAPEIVESLANFLRLIREPEHVWRARWQPGQVLDPVALQRAWESQLVIGPQGFLEGLLSTHWAPLQQAYFQQKGSRRSGRKWATSVAQKLIMIGFNMWEYRNSVFHSDQSVENKELSKQLDATIEAQVQKGPEGLSKPARHQLSLPLGRLLAKPLNQRVQWVKWIEAERSLEKQTTKGRRRILKKMLKDGKTKIPSGQRVQRVFNTSKRKEIKRRQVSITHFAHQ